jgi:hypothetical protein
MLGDLVVPTLDLDRTHVANDSVAETGKFNTFFG